MMLVAAILYNGRIENTRHTGVICLRLVLWRPQVTKLADYATAIYLYCLYRNKNTK